MISHKPVLALSALCACVLPLRAQPLAFVDNYRGNLSSAYTAGGGSLSVVACAALPAGATYFYLKVKAEGANTDEDFLVTNVSGSGPCTLTVSGAKGSTSASNHAIGATVLASIMNSDAFAQLKSELGAVPGCSSDGAGGVLCTGSFTAGNGGSTTGALDITGGTSGSTLTVTTDADTPGGTLKAYNPDGGTYYTPYISGTLTAGNCLKSTSDGKGIQDAGSCGTANSNGLILIEQHTASSSAALNFTTCISSTYDDYQIELVNLVPATNSVLLELQVSTNGGVSYVSTTSYLWQYWIVSSAAGSSISASAGGSFIQLGEAIVNTTNRGGVSGKIDLYSPLSSSAYKSFVFQDAWWTANFISNQGTGSFADTTAMNAFRLMFSSGNIASGTARCYAKLK